MGQRKTSRIGSVCWSKVLFCAVWYWFCVCWSKVPFCAVCGRGCLFLWEWMKGFSLTLTVVLIGSGETFVQCGVRKGGPAWTTISIGECLRR